MKCMRCGNQDKRFFFQDGDIFYCRKCISFGRLNVGEEIEPKVYQTKKHRCHYVLDYPLTPAQQIASKKLLDSVKLGRDSLLYAACGSGKTEIVMDSLQYGLNKGLKVGFAISRRQVVLEIQARMKKAFPRLQVIAVCEGFTSITDGDLIVCTMHQLYRYHQTFDLLIMDEVDAFPYKHNELLEHVAMNAVKGSIIYLTATPDEAMLRKVEKGEWELVTLFQRPHGYPLMIPKEVKALEWMQLLVLILFINHCQKLHKQLLVFVPTKRCGMKLYRFFKYVYRCRLITSSSTDKEEVIQMMRDKQLLFLITTTILERGVTFDDIQVALFKGDHPVFDEASLIQIIGRVGRNIHHPEGEALLMYTRRSFAIKQCVAALHKMNA